MTTTRSLSVASSQTKKRQRPQDTKSEAASTKKSKTTVSKRNKTAKRPLSPLSSISLKSSVSTIPSVATSARMDKSPEYEILPDTPIDFTQWFHTSVYFLQKIHNKFFGEKQIKMVMNEELQQMEGRTTSIVSKLYAILHGRVSLELEQDITCDGVLQPRENVESLLFASEQRAKKILEQDVRKAIKQQQAIHTSYTKASEAHALALERMNPEDAMEVSQHPLNPPHVNPIIYAFVNEEVYNQAIEERKQTALEEFYINITKAAEKYKSYVEDIIHTYEQILHIDSESKKYRDLPADVQLSFREYLLISIMLDNDVDIPSVIHEGTKSIRKKSIKKLCEFYKTIKPIRPLSETIVSMPPSKRYAVPGDVHDGIQIYIQSGVVWYKFPLDPNFKRSQYNANETVSMLKQGKDPSEIKKRL